MQKFHETDMTRLTEAHALLSQACALIADARPLSSSPTQSEFLAERIGWLRALEEVINGIDEAA